MVRVLATDQGKRPSGSLFQINNAKTVKGEALGYLTGIMYLAPARESEAQGGGNVCAMATPDCIRDCLFTAGRGAMANVKNARVRKTLRYFNDRAQFVRDLVADVQAVHDLAQRYRLKPALRINGTSDILWERVKADGCANIFDRFSDVQFYDYTKHKPGKRANLPRNYHLTFSAQRHTLQDARDALAAGWNVAAVVCEPERAALLALDGVCNADEHDLRFMDGRGMIGLLTPKGSLRKATAATSRLILTYEDVRALMGAGHAKAA